MINEPSLYLDRGSKSFVGLSLPLQFYNHFIFDSSQLLVFSDDFHMTVFKENEIIA